MKGSKLDWLILSSLILIGPVDFLARRYLPGPLRIVLISLSVIGAGYVLLKYVPGPFKIVSQAIDRLSAGAGWIANWLVLAACLVSAGNAVVRYVFGFSSNSLLEIQWYFFGALVFLGASHTFRMNEHVRVDIIYSSISEEKQIWVDIVGLILFFMPVVIFLTWLSFPLFWQSFRSGEVSNNPGGLIVWPAKLLIPLGFGLLALQGVSELIKRVLVLQGLMRLELRYEKPVQ